jgi:dihydrodipicolinate synthase/N-acetylneuraminate lyase
MLNREDARARLSGCLIAVPTLFRDDDLELNLPAMRRHIRFLLEGGVRQGNAVLLVCGGAGDFTTLSVEERLRIAEAVLDEACGKVGVMLGAQSTNLREITALARGAARLGVVALQVAPPFYHVHTDDDVCEFLDAIGQSADVGLVFYTTYWVSKISLDLIARVIEIPNVVGLKWAVPNTHEYMKGLQLFAKKVCVIDNQLLFVLAHMLGAAGVNTHPGNYWPEWSVRFWGLLEAGKYREAQDESLRVVTPYYDLSYEIEKYTGGEGHLDKLCLELVGLDSSRGRLPMRDIRPAYREKVRQMLRRCGVPRC